MIYYACFDDHPQWVQAHTGGAVEVRRFPIAVGVSNTVEVNLDYHADAFMTAENVHEYCITLVLPRFLDEAVRRFPIAVGVSNTVEVNLDYHADAFMTAENVHEYCITLVLPRFLDEARKLIAAHNNDPKSHPHILAGLEDFDARLSLIELQYGTDVNGNPFIVTFETLDTVEVHLDYHADAFMTAENVHEYCITVVLPQFLDEARKLIAEHNNDPKAHPHILAGLEDFDARLSLIELQYGTDVNGNPFIVTFETLDGVNVQGVWNEPGRRIEF